MKDKHPGGRPRKFNEKQIKEIQDKLERYIEENNIPIIVEFAYKNNVSRDDLYDYKEFSTLLKKCIAKKEANLERLSLNRETFTPGIIFSLKQLGWSDKKEVAITTDDETKRKLEEIFNDRYSKKNIK